MQSQTPENIDTEKSVIATLFISQNSIAGKVGKMKKVLFTQSFTIAWFAGIAEFFS